MGGAVSACKVKAVRIEVQTKILEFIPRSSVLKSA
jgi:hypothetical protein